MLLIISLSAAGLSGIDYLGNPVASLPKELIIERLNDGMPVSELAGDLRLRTLLHLLIILAGVRSLVLIIYHPKKIDKIGDRVRETLT